jgi:hypothetical protein
MDTRVFPTEAVTGRGKPLAVEDATILSVTVQLPVSLSLIKHWGYRCEVRCFAKRPWLSAPQSLPQRR